MTPLIADFLSFWRQDNLFFVLRLISEHRPRGQTVESSLDLLLRYTWKIGIRLEGLFLVEEIEDLLCQVAAICLQWDGHRASCPWHDCVAINWVVNSSMLY